MVFDAKKYADAMDRFHILIANVSELDSPEIGHALEEVCRVLRVAKVDMKCYDAISLETIFSCMKVRSLTKTEFT